MEPVSTLTTAIATGAWFGNKLLGPTLESMGEDLKQLYKGRDKIVANSIKKTKNIDDGGKTNLRVTRDVFWNGSYTDESICAEYFGGVLASSRSVDGQDDSGVYYVDLIKSLSSTQLYLHYVMYRSLNKILIQDPGKEKLNVGLDTELYQQRIHFSSIELVNLGLKIDVDLEALYRKGLLHEYRINIYSSAKEEVLPYTMVIPTTLGIQLFAIANNLLLEWRSCNSRDFGGFQDVLLPKHYAYTVEELFAMLS